MKKYCFLFSEGSKIRQIICAVLINLPVFAYGASIGWMSPMTLLLQSENSPTGRALTDLEISWMGSIAYLVCVPANIMMGILSDKFGRKKTLMFMSAVGMGCWVIKLSSLEVWAFVLARSLIGILMAGSYVASPLYTKEISETSVRGMLGSLVVLFHTTGNLFLYIIGDILSYNAILWVCLSLPAIHLILFITMPESPSYLVKKGELDRAVKALAWLRCREEDDTVVINELDQLKKEQLQDEGTEKFALKAILSDKILFRAFKIAIIVAVAREFCGTVPVMNFAGDIFKMSSEGTGLVLTPNQQAMMLGTVQIAGSVLTFGTVEKFGRKTLLFITALVSGLSMVALASWFLARENGIYTSAWLPIITLCLCIFCDSYGLQPISVIITGEIFSFKYRGSVLSLAMAIAGLFAFLQMLFFKPLASTIGVYIAFYIFGAICLLAALYTILVVPETKQKGLEEIYEHLKTKKERKMEAENRIQNKKLEAMA